MALEEKDRISRSTSLIFEPEGGLFGPDAIGIDWRQFIGIGSLDGPLRAPFSIGGPVNAWAPFVGDFELFRARLSGEIATRVGLEVGLEVSAGATRATLPYEISFSFPDADALAANPFFRLEGSGFYADSVAAGFETEWPYLALNIAAIFELAVLAELEMGVLGENTTRKLLDFDFATSLPIVDLDTRDRGDAANREARLFGLDIGEIASVSGGFTPPPGVAGAPLIDLDLGDTLTVEFGTDGLDLFSSPAKQDEREATDARNGEAGADSSDPDAQTQDASGKQTTSVLDAFDTGPLATLDLRLPSITLEDRGGGGPAALDAPVIYTDRTETAAEAAESGDRSNNVADLTLDLDNILVEIVKSALAGPTLQKLPGLEGRVDLGYELGGFGAGAYFDYNLFDADLVLSLPIRQEVSVETQPLLTRLSFSRGDDKGNPVVNDGAEEAFFVTARMPRYSVYFNEGATFANADVAALLRQAAGLSARAAEDVALFADLDAGLIPGAFTGQTGGVAGGFVIRTENDPNWRQLSTFPEETEWLARSRPIVGVETPLEDLRPRDGARFKYVVYTDDTRVQNGVVDLATAVGHVDLAFADLVGFGEVFDVRVDAVSAPISATGLIEGAPSLDLIFPEGVADSVWVEVEHLARATVDNRTTLDFDMNIALSALEFAFGAYVQAFGGRFGIDFEFGPLWEKVYPILSTTLAALYDDEFDIATDRFTVGGETSAQPTDRWGFAIGAGGDAIPLVITGTPGDDVIDGARALGRQPGGTPVAAAVTGGGAGVDLLTFARLGAPTPLWADIGRGAAVVGLTPAALAAFEAAGGAGEPAAGPTTGRLAFSGVENLTGGRLGDLLAGDGGANRIDGGEGHDTLDGRGGADALFGGPGSDVLIMAGTTDGTEAFGGDGDDRLIAGGGRGLYDGGQGAPVGAGGLIPVDLDVIDYRAAPGAILIDLATGARSGPWVTGHELRNIEGVAGTAFDDTLQGDAGRSYFEGGDGDDLLIGDPLGEGLADRLSLPGGLDRLYGGSGDDTLVGGPGADMLDGGPGRDLVDYSADPTSVYVDMAAALTVDPERFAPLLIPAGTDPTDYARIDGQGWRGWAQGDKLRDVEDLRGSAFDDILFGDPDANRIEGGDGDDRIAGRFGADTLEGGAGNDVLWTRSAAAVAQGSYQPVLNRDPFTPGFQTTGTMAIGGLLLGHDPARLIGGEDRDLAILQWTPGFTVVQQNLLVSNYYDTKDPFERAVELRYEAPSLTQRLVASIEDGGALVEIAAASSDRTLFVTGARMAGSDAWADIGRWRSIDFFNGVADNIRELSDALRPFVGTDFGDWFADAPIAFTLDAPIRFDVAGLDGIEGLIGGVSAEFLIGSGIGDALYAGGGSDRVAGLGGDDVLSVGPGQPAEQIFSFPGRGYAGLAALERQLGEAYAGASSPRDPGAADQRLIDPVVRVIEPAGGFGDAALSAAAANGFAPRSAATQLFQNTPAEIDPFDPVARLGARPSAEVPARQAAIDALLVAYLAGPRDAAALDALSKALAATDQRLGEYAIVDGGPGVDTLDLRYDRGLDFLSRPGELAVMVDLEATATRFSVLPGFALPWTLTDTPSGNESDTPDPTAFSWKPLPAFTAGAAVGEVVFLRPALAETGPVGADRVTNAAAPPSAALPALLLGVENLIGTAYADRLFGDAGDNVIEGGAGAAVRRLAPVQGQANAVIAVYADWMDGRGGFDTLSYANAVAGVTLTLGQRADGALDVLASAGDAAGDLFAGFEALRGSEQRDRLGFTGADLPDDALTAVYSANAIAVVDGGGGSDLIAAARAGVTFLGGDGDDVIDVNRDPDPGRRTAADADGAFRATVGAALPAVGPMTMTVDGGAGVDVARLSGVGLAALTLDGDALRVTETVDPSFAATLDDPRRATLETTLLGVEYLEIGAGDAVETLALDNLDPVVGPQRALALSEDPWSVRRLFAAEGPGAPAPDRVATVESLSGAGVFALDGPGGPAPVTLGQVVDAAALSRLVFIPGQGFGFPLAEGPDAPRAAASLGLSFGGPGVAPQSRVIRVEPGDFDGASLGLATPTDVEHEPVVLAMIDRSDRDAEGRPTDDRVWLFLPSDIDERLVAAQQSRIDAVLDLRRWQLAEADLEADLAVFAQLPPFIRVAFQSVIDNIGLALNDARARQADAQSVIDAAVETQAEIQEEATRPIIDLPRADAYRVTGVTEGGTLWLAEEATASDPVLVTPVAVGTALARADLGRLVFVKDGGLVDADDAVSIAPIEALSVTILEVPTAGFVFDPVIALGLDPAAMTGAAPTEPATLLAGPSEGALFLRGVDGSRIPVAVGDALDAAQIAGLFFEAGIAREATDVSATELAAQIFALNRPTGDDGPDRSGLADGVGAVAAPADPTGLILQVDLGGPVAAEVDGLVVDMEAAGLTRLVVYDGAIRFRGAALDWRQWTVEQGGNGHFYAVGSDTRTTSSLNLYDALVRSDLEARREVPFELASIAEAAENDFAFNLFADDPTMFNDIFGPILGARALGAGRRWTWDDGSPWTFTAWRQGEPNDFGGAEDALQYSITRVDDEERLVLPTWNDHRTNYGAPGWVLESRGLATARNDVATGSQAADHIDGGAGDDLLSGGAGDDSIIGGAGRDTLAGGEGDDTLTGGAGADLFVMGPGGGYDVLLDFEGPWRQGGVVTDRIDVTGLGLSSLAQLRLTTESDGIALHAAGTTFFFKGTAQGDLVHFLNPQLYVGAPRYLGAAMPGIEALTLAVGDTIAADNLAGLRYRAGQDATGSAGQLRYEARDPWALPDGVAGLADPRDAATDGAARSGATITLIARNDAPRSADRAYHVSVDGALDGRVDVLRLKAIDPEGDAVSFRLIEGPAHGALEFDADGGFFYRPDAGFAGSDAFRFEATDGAATSAPYTVRLEVLDTSAPRGPEPGAERVEGFLRIGGLTADDWLVGDGGDNAFDAGPGDDRIEAGGGRSRVAAGSGDDTVIVGPSTGPVEIDGEGGDDAIDVVGDVGDGGAVRGGDGDDDIGVFGALRDGVLDGGPGDDTLRLDGADLAGTDLSGFAATIVTGPGRNRIDASELPDLGAISVEETTAGFDARFTLTATAGRTADFSALTLDAGEALFVDTEGQLGGDAFAADFSGVTLDPAAPPHLRYLGGAADEAITGSSGGDDLNGAGGADRITGGAGDDTLTGGADRDVFVATAANGDDVVTDFADGEDAVDLRQLGGEAALLAFLTATANDDGDTVLTFVSGGSMTLRGLALAAFDITDLRLEEGIYALDDAAAVDEDAAVTIDVLANDADADGDALTISGFGQGASGAVALIGGQLRYTPNANFSGADSFTYQVSDGGGDVAVATVSVTVNPMNDAPTARDDGFSTDEDTAVSGDLLADNAFGPDLDIDGDAVTVVAVNGAAASVGARIALASGALLTVNADGTFVYDPNAAFDALAASDLVGDGFTYVIADGNGGMAEAFVTVAVFGVNDAPLLSGPSAVSVAENATAAASFAAVDADAGQTPAFSIAGGADAALFAIDAATGSLRFRAAPDFEAPADAGGDNVYDVVVGAGDGTATATLAVAVTVTDVDETLPNRAPVAADDRYATGFGNVLTVDAAAGLLANDGDPDLDAITVASVGSAANGVANVLADGSFTYTPNVGFSGTETIAYTISDGFAQSTATLTIEVAPPVNAAPTPADDAFTVAEDAPLSGSLFADNGSGPDGDPDGDALVVTAVNGSAVSVGAQIALASGALLTVNADGTFAYDQSGAFGALNAGGVGMDGFEYAVSDGKGGTASATVSIAIAGETDLNFVLGTSGSDRLTGTNGADLIRPLGGRSDVVTGLGGADVFDFSDSTADGARDLRTIVDYASGEDMIELGSIGVLRATERAGLVTLYLEGDGDVISVRGVSDVDDIAFI